MIFKQIFRASVTWKRNLIDDQDDLLQKLCQEVEQRRQLLRKCYLPSPSPGTKSRSCPGSRAKISTVDRSRRVIILHSLLVIKRLCGSAWVAELLRLGHSERRHFAGEIEELARSELHSFPLYLCGTVWEDRARAHAGGQEWRNCRLVTTSCSRPALNPLSPLSAEAAAAARSVAGNYCYRQGGGFEDGRQGELCHHGAPSLPH